MDKATALWGRQPAMVLSFVRAVIYLGMAFGLSLTPEQLASILVVVELGLGLLTRSQVVPTGKVRAKLMTVKLTAERERNVDVNAPPISPSEQLLEELLAS